MKKTLEEVDGLRRRFREHLLEGDLRVAWVLLLGSLAAIRFLCGLEWEYFKVEEERWLTDSLMILRMTRSSGVPIMRIMCRS